MSPRASGTPVEFAFGSVVFTALRVKFASVLSPKPDFVKQRSAAVVATSAPSVTASEDVENFMVALAGRVVWAREVRKA